MHRNCLICSRENFKVIFTEFNIPILKCRECGHICSSYQPPEHYEGYFGEETLPGEAEYSYWGKAHFPMYAEFARRYLKNKKGHLLDVGCGLGYFLAQIKEIPSWELYGCETSPVAVEYGIKRLGLPHLHQGSLESAPYPEDFFDVITLWDVLEHIPQPDTLLKRISTLLKPDGFLFLHTPNAKIQIPKAKLKKTILGMKEGIHYLEAKDHCHLYTPHTLAILLKRNGFQEIKMTHLPPIMAVSGNNSSFRVSMKKGWYYSVKALETLSMGTLNLDNLFCLAKKK